MDGTITVCTHRLGADGRLVDGVRLYPGDRAPHDLDLELLRKLRTIGWVEEIPASKWQPPPEDVLTAREARLEEQQRMVCYQKTSSWR